MDSTFGMRRKSISGSLRGMSDQSPAPVRRLMLLAISRHLSRRFSKTIAVGPCDVSMQFFSVGLAAGDVGDGILIPPDDGRKIEMVPGPAWAEAWVSSWLMVAGEMTPTELADAIDRVRLNRQGAEASEFYSAGRGPLESADYDAATM